MRFLFSFVGGRGHFDPMVPVARALAARGHQVAVAGRAVQAVEQAGFRVFPTGAAAEPAAVRLPMPPVDPARDDWEIRELFIRRAVPERVPVLLDLCRKWRPDVVVRDEVDFAAALVAEKLGLPCATVLVLASETLLRKESITEPLREARAGHGLPDDPEPDPGLVLSPFPPTYRAPGTAFTFRAAEPIPPRPRAQRPGVYFTLGTNFNLESGDLIERALAGLGRLAADVTATVGTQLDPAQFGPQPANVRVERFVRQADLLPHTDLVVSHGGSGGVLGTLTHGLPSLLLPMGADQPGNASRGVELGTARVLDPETATPEEIHEAAEDLLTDPVWREAAQRVREEINAQPGAEETAPLLEALVTASGRGSFRPAP
ncbi:glycosyltransferase [Amycolatopsis jiangsuensis]|uniref:UDP:flavonoid glycosyltransferase YjiC (YdhE family) n=1 Tax=Amycolatopsis jiangsuensis TaxID=1181879 RepID=A0A840IZU0_9PSEU|nr:glycosyltransferase [Amycolatopsis jiangsuensis]MBB4686678.1 UDP:flavonoid glycosyltransferase YjiC (YdhE family) [Amycolatopsis jiangsuensis]